MEGHLVVEDVQLGGDILELPPELRVARGWGRGLGKVRCDRLVSNRRVGYWVDKQDSSTLGKDEGTCIKATTKIMKDMKYCQKLQ